MGCQMLPTQPSGPPVVFGHKMSTLVLLCTLESVSPVLFPTLMLTQETFSILPQEHLGKLLSSGLKVSSLCFSQLIRLVGRPPVHNRTLGTCH